eukprot:2403043-Prymnesium_polylepis.1
MAVKITAFGPTGTISPIVRIACSDPKFRGGLIAFRERGDDIVAKGAAEAGGDVDVLGRHGRRSGGSAVMGHSLALSRHAATLSRYGFG